MYAQNNNLGREYIEYSFFYSYELSMITVVRSVESDTALIALGIDSTYCTRWRNTSDTDVNTGLSM